MNLSGEQLLEDAQFIVNTVLNVHPRPEFRLGIEGLSNAKEEFLTTATKAKERSDFWRCTAKFMSRIGDAHTEVMALESGELQAPVILSFIGGQVVVEEVMPSSSLSSLLEKGDVLLFVNSKEVGQLLREKMDYVAYNYFDHGRNMALPQLLRFPEDSRENVELTVAKGDGNVVSVTSELYSTEDTTYKAWQRQRSITALADYLSWKLLDDLKAGYLKYKRCFDRTSEYFVKEAKQLGLKAEGLPDMQEVCTALFKSMQDSGYKRLIIDLRGNSGGNSMVARPLFKYLTRKPLKSYGWGIRASKEAKNLIESSRAKYPAEFQHLLDEILAIPDGEYMNMGSSSIDYPFHSGDWTYIEHLTVRYTYLPMPTPSVQENGWRQSSGTMTWPSLLASPPVVVGQYLEIPCPLRHLMRR